MPPVPPKQPPAIKAKVLPPQVMTNFPNKKVKNQTGPKKPIRKLVSKKKKKKKKTKENKKPPPKDNEKELFRVLIYVQVAIYFIGIIGICLLVLMSREGFRIRLYQADYG